MYYYVYKVTNLINGKFYIGKRGNKNPATDGYMGSGKLILSAIKKYGKQNFKKEIIKIFNTNKEAAELEKALVTKELIESNNSYNMHEGGHGGFLHINNLPPNERINIKAFREKVKNCEIVVGGTKHWTENSFKRAAEQARKNNEEGLTKGWKHTEQFKKEQSKRACGEKNSQYGKQSYTFLATGEKKKFKKEEVPSGWILTKELLEEKMRYSKRWYNDGIKNYYIVLPNPIIKELNLKKGRIR